MRTQRVPALLGALLVCVAARAQVTGQPAPVAGTAETGGELTIDVVVDVGETGGGLGSYGASVAWDSSVVLFQGFAGGQPPFDARHVNTEHAFDGLLTFADASAVGATGSVRLLTIAFEAVAEPPGPSVLDLEFSSLFGAGDFTDLTPGLEVQDGAVCVSDFAYELRVSGPSSTRLDWSAIPQAVAYDVIRGDLASLWADGAVVHLGRPICVENDSSDTTTGAGAEPAKLDPKLPAPGQGFYYLVRFHDGIANRTYGYFRDCVRERIVDIGGCP